MMQIRHGLPHGFAARGTAFDNERVKGVRAIGRPVFGSLQALGEEENRRKKEKSFAGPLVSLAFAALSLLGVLGGARPASAAQPPVDQPAVSAVMQEEVASPPLYTIQSEIQAPVAISGSVVNSAEDIPALPADSTQRVIDVAGRPLLTDETRAYLEEQLAVISQSNYVGDVYVVVVPDTQRDIMALASEINQKLNPSGDGAVLVLNAAALRNNHRDIKEVHTWTSIQCIPSGKSTICYPVTHTSTHYHIQDNMLQVTQGPAVFQNMDRQLRMTEPGLRQESVPGYVQAEFDKLKQDYAEAPDEVRRDIYNHFWNQIQESRNDENYTIYQGDFDQVARDIVTDLRDFYEDPIHEYVADKAHDARLFKAILITAGAGTGVTIGGLAVKHKLDSDRENDRRRRGCVY